MARVAIAPLASIDHEEIVTYLACEAAPDVVTRYIASFRELFAHLAKYPESGAPRPQYGKGTRLRVVWP